MENTNQDLVRQISNTVRQINKITLKIQHLSNDEKLSDSAIKPLAGALAQYCKMLSEPLGIEFKSLEEVLNKNS